MTQATNQHDLRGDVRTALATERVTQAQLGREIGVSSSVVNQWLQGVYAGDNATVEDKICRWLDARRAARANGETMPAAPGFFATPTAQKVIDALGYAQIAGDIVVIYGSPGLGKTTAIARYGATGLNVWHATMSPACSKVVSALQEICAALGIGDVGGGASTLYRAILRRVRGTNGLLVIDEAQFLSVAALEQIRAIHDAVGVGIALVGNESVYKRMSSGRCRDELDRLFSRVGKRVPLRGVSTGDISALLEAWGIEDKAIRAELRGLAERFSALRTVTKVLRLASMNAMAASAPLDVGAVRHAWGELMGVEE